MGKKKDNKVAWDDLLTGYLLIGLVWGFSLAKGQVLGSPSPVPMAKFILGAIST